MFKLNRQHFPNGSRLLAGLLMGMLSIFLPGCQSAQNPKGIQTDCRRVVSLSPSVTEVLYALDLGKQVVGVTRFCKYPPDARKKPSVGGYVDPNVEAIMRLKPDLVIIRQEQDKLIQQVRDLNLPVLPVDHRNMAGVLDSFQKIGQTCHREKQAETFVNRIKARIAAIQAKVRMAKTTPKVLVALDRDVSSDTVKWVYVAGQGSIYDWVIRQSGAQNAVPAGRPGFMQVSSEGILRMDPDVIIELLPYVNATEQNAIEARRQWASLSPVKAVRQGRVYLFSKDYMVIPGPRFIGTLEQFAPAIHPELDWKHDQPAQRL